MKSSTRFFLILVLSVTSCFVFSQNEYSKWYFGNNAALDFMTNPPTPLFNSAMNTIEGCSSIADGAGNLLFYTDGIRVWNSQNLVMANGTGLFGSQNSSQSALIVKQPGNANIYFIFTTDALGNANGLRYSTVDMSLAVGLGSVTVKNTPLFTPITERLCAVRHCNGIDVWVITHDFGSTTFRANLVSATGVNAIGVLSSVGTAYIQSVNSMGYMKVSPTGRKLVTGLTDPVLGPFLELYDFDNATGIVSNPISINCATADSEFSSDGTKLYGCVAQLNPASSQLVQLDLCKANAAIIASSAYSIACPLSHRMQRATNGKIYIAEIIGSNFSVIDNPNVLGAGCNLLPNVVSVAPNNNSASLPGFVTEIIPTPITFTNTPSGCNTASFSIPNCPVLNTNFTNILWDFGDPASGVNNTSTSLDPVHTYPGPGTYTVKVIYYYPCSSDTLLQTIVIAATPLNAVSQTICAGQNATLTASGNITYTWSSGQNSASVVVTPTATTVYTVQGTGQAGCINSNTVSVLVNPLPTLSISGNASVCPTDIISLGAAGANTYTWSVGQQGPAITFSPPVAGTFTVYGRSILGCIGQQTISTFIYSLPSITISGNTTLCPGSSVINTASGALSYNWSTGATSSTVNLSPLSNSVYTVTGNDLNGCTGSNTVFISLVTTAPQTTFSYTSLCEKSETIIPVKHPQFNEGGVFSSAELLVNAATGEVDINSPSGTYSINYFVQANGCFAFGSENVILNILPIATLNISPDRNVAPGSSAIISVSGGSSYSWTPPDYLSCTNCSDPVTSPLNDIQYCVTSLVNGCKSEACMEITVSCETGNNYSLPNAFSPNGDGNNDLFCLQGWDNCVIDFEARIFNRWGENVFSSTDRSFCWDGIYKGKVLEPDVFVYVVKATFSSSGKNKIITKKGNISLIR